MDCLHCRSYGPLRVFFQASCSRRSESLFGQPFSVALLIQALRGPLPAVLFCCWARQAHRGAHLAGLLLCRSAYQALKGAPWVRSYSGVQCIRRLMGQPLYCSAADAGVWGERGFGDGSSHYRVTQKYCFASMAAQVFSTGISHSNLLVHIPSICLSVINSSPHPGIAPQSLNSIAQPLHLPGDLCPCPTCIWLQQGLSRSHSI